MKELLKLYRRIVQRVNINLREFNFDVEPLICDLVSFDELEKVHGFYAITSQHPLDFQFRDSNLAGSYFLGKCRTTNSILYKSDIRGDEWKKKGTVFYIGDFQIPLTKDEGIHIEDSLFIKTLVHNFSHDPETPERFTISNTVSAHYANIHGSPTDGTFLEPFSTIDLTTVNDCIIGAFSYIQAGEINHFHIKPGTVWVRSAGTFNFLYRYPADVLHRYIRFYPGSPPQGIFVEFVNKYKEAFERVFETVKIKSAFAVPPNTSLDRFAAIIPKISIKDNVLVAQRALLQNSSLGRGANVQENCFIINSNLAGYNVTAHGAKLIDVDMEEMVFVGFNSFLSGQGCRLTIGRDSIIMPHTIIDIQKPLHIPAGSLVWGVVTCEDELAANSISLKVLRQLEDGFCRGNLVFEGSGNQFVSAFQSRIQHILDANGAFYDGEDNKGHAQKNQNISFNIIQPYSEGSKKGIYPTIIIRK